MKKVSEIVGEIRGVTQRDKIVAHSMQGKPLILKTFILQFIYEKGNGWAIVNATNITEAESVFKRQTKFKDAIITGIKETKWFGNSMQLVFEGSVTTCANVDVTISLSDLIENSDAFDSVESYLNSIFNFSDYYTKEEIEERIPQAVSDALIELGSDLPNLDLTDYVKKSELTKAVDDALDDLNIHSGKDGATPEIDETTYHWIIDGYDTGVKAKGEDGAPGTPGTNGTNGTNGVDGVGIANITYSQSTISGGVNKLTITMTNGITYGPFNIKNGKDGTNGTGGGTGTQSEQPIQMGTIDDAKTIANSSPTSKFVFILNGTDTNNNQYRKPIWYCGDGKFIDAVGTIMATITV